LGGLTSVTDLYSSLEGYIEKKKEREKERKEREREKTSKTRGDNDSTI
jgi:hypothetical protein